MALSLSVSMNSTDPLGSGPNGFYDRMDAFEAVEVAARKQAAQTATQISRKSFKRKRDIAAPRPGRSGQGKMTSFIRWAALSSESGVTLRSADLSKAAPHWIIQEIGTGENANILRATQAGPESVRAVSIRSQKGRRISSGLMWASAGRYVPPNRAGGTQNLASRVGPGGFARNSMVIRKEIEGQNFIQKGSQEGFREYRVSVLAAARQQFRRGKR